MSSHVSRPSSRVLSSTHSSTSLPRSDKKGSEEVKELSGKNRLGLTPPKRINVANKAVADELLVSQNLLFLQQDDYYKAQEHIQLLSGEVDALKEVVKKKQSLINKLQQGISDRDNSIEELKKEVAHTHVERTAFKVLEEQNSSLMLKVTSTGQKLEDLNRDLRAKTEEQKDIREYSDAKVKDAVKTEVLLQSTIQQLGFNLSLAEQSKDQAVMTQKKLHTQMEELQKHLQLVSETSKEELYRSRQTEYRTLRRLDEMTTKFVAERDEKELLRDTVKLASMRGDVLANRLGDALEKTEGQQLMVQSIVRQVENSNDALRARERVLEKQNMHLTAQLKLSQLAVADMLRRYKIAEQAIEQGRIEVYELKQAAKPRKKGESKNIVAGTGVEIGEKTKKRPPGMAGSTTANANKLFMQKLASLTSDSAKQLFPEETTLLTAITHSVLSGRKDEEADGAIAGMGQHAKGKRGLDSASVSAREAAESAEAAAAMDEYNAFIYDDNSVDSRGTFQSRFSDTGCLDAGRAVYGDDQSLDPSQNLPDGSDLVKPFTGFVDAGFNDLSVERPGSANDFAGVSVGDLSAGKAVYDVMSGTGSSEMGTIRPGTHQAAGLTQGAAAPPPLPQLQADQAAHAEGKANLLTAYMRMVISVQNHLANIPQTQASGRNSGNANTLPRLPNAMSDPGSGLSSGLQILDLARCELLDEDMKKVMDLMRLLSLKEMIAIDMKHNHFTIKSIDTVGAFVVAIAGADLQRNVPLEIDLRYNHLSARAIERLAARLRSTPRPEVKLVTLEDNNQVILLYGLNKVLIRIDCRANNGDSIKVKKSLKERIGLGENITGALNVAFPGDDIAARNPNYFTGTIYPRDEILKAKIIK